LEENNKVTEVEEEKYELEIPSTLSETNWTPI